MDHQKDGNLFKKENLLYYYETMVNSVDLVTGDGGFDFSLDFNNQETNSFKLILVQVIYALCIQKKGGSFVLKIFDIFTLPTIHIIFILSSIYENVFICKPNTSRIANSEKYLVCKNYKFNKNIIKYFINNFDNLFNNNQNIYSLINLKIPYLFLSKVEEYNAIYGQQQIENINFTINLINISNNKKQKIKDNNKSTDNKCTDNKSVDNNKMHNDNNKSIDNKTCIEIEKENNLSTIVIENNIEYIDIDNNNTTISSTNNNLEIIKKNNLHKCVQWCIRNNLPFNTI